MIHHRLISLLAAASLSACYGYVEPGTVGVTSADIMPPVVDIEASPYVYYEGHPTYYYGNRWYYRDRNQWRYYRSEPSYLQQHRGRFDRERRGPVQRGPVQRGPVQRGPGPGGERHER